MLVSAVKTLVGALWREGITAEFCYEASMSLEAQRTQAELLCCEWFVSLAACNSNDSTEGNFTLWCIMLCFESPKVTLQKVEVTLFWTREAEKRLCDRLGYHRREPIDGLKMTFFVRWSAISREEPLRCHRKPVSRGILVQIERACEGVQGPDPREGLRLFGDKRMTFDCFLT